MEKTAQRIYPLWTFIRFMILFHEQTPFSCQRGEIKKKKIAEKQLLSFVDQKDILVFHTFFTACGRFDCA